MWFTIPHALKNIAFLRDFLSKVHLAAHGGGKTQHCHLIFPSAKPLNINDESLRITGCGDLTRRDLGRQTLGTTPVKDKRAETLIALDRRGTRNYLLTTRVKADRAPSSSAARQKP